MTTREAPPIEQSQVQELPTRLSPYAALLLRSYMEDQGEEDNSQKARLFAFALIGAAALAFRNPNLKNVPTSEIAARYSDIARDAVSEFRANHPDEGADSPASEAFIRNASGGLATAAGSQTTLELLKVIDPGGTAYKKLWMTRGDPKVRESHRRLHGQTASIGDEFSPGLSYPGDPLAPLSETINCRCFLFAVPASESDQAAKAFEPADLEMAFAASAMTAASGTMHTLKRLMRSMPWLWQPRDRDGKWIDVGDTLYAPHPNRRGVSHRVTVTDVVGRDRIKVQSVDFPDRSWEVDSRDTTPDVSKARIPEVPGNPLRRVRQPVHTLDPQKAGAPIFESSELQPGDVVAVRTAGIDSFNYMMVDSLDVERNQATFRYPPEPKYQAAGFDDEMIFQLEESQARMVLNLSDGNVHEAIDQDAVFEVNKRFDDLTYGFANPKRAKNTEVFKTGADRTAWAPERKRLHDKVIQETFDAAIEVDEPKFYMMGGGPASGKSTMLLADSVEVPLGENGIQINADEIKKRIPEYVGLMEANDKNAAPFAHKESSEVSSRMIREAPETKHVVLDGVGDKGVASVEARLETARRRGQRTIANYATLPTELAVKLSEARFRDPGPDGGRYVPEDYIRSAHADVTDTFFDLAKRGSLDELYLWNTEMWDAERKVGIPRPIFSQVDGVSTIHDEALLIEFLQKSHTGKHTVESIRKLTTKTVKRPKPFGRPKEGFQKLLSYDEWLEQRARQARQLGLPIVAAGEVSIEGLLAQFDWDTRNEILNEAMAELSGSKFESTLPDTPDIRTIKESLKAEAREKGGFPHPVNDEP